MAVSVYPHLHALLRDRDLSILELKRTIEDRYRLVVDLATLQSFAGSEPVEQTNLALAGAVATVLGVRLDELFTIEAVPTTLDAPVDSFLTDAQSARLTALLDQQDHAELNTSETDELADLLDEYGRLFREHHLRSYAAKRGISFEEAVHEADLRIAEASDSARRMDDDPGERQRLAMRVKQQKASTRR